MVAVMVAVTATSGYGFTTIPGDLKQITASTNYFWGVNKNDDIFNLNASVPATVTGVKLVAN